MPSKRPWTFDTATYNRLPRLEVATKKLDGLKPQFDLFVRETSAILGEANLGKGEVGAFLLHRHWNLKPKHLMVERPRVLENGQVALITAAADVASSQRSLLTPSRWAAPSTERPMVALEFSVDPFVSEIVGKLTSNRPLVASLARSIEKHGLQETVGYMVIPRKSIPVDPQTDFVETNAGRISIVTGELLSAEEK
jgi:hypothetical protein